MKKAISIWSFKDKTIKEAICMAKQAGFDGIELSLDETGPVSLESGEGDLLDVKAYAHEQGIKIHSLATGLYWTYSMTSNDKDERDMAVNIAQKQIKAAKALGADSVLIVPGAVGADFIPEREPVRYDIAHERALNALKEIKATAESYEINACIENVWNKFLLSPLEMRSFIDQIDSPFIGAYFDVGNVVYSGYPEHWIEILGERIKKVHFKDYRKAAGGLHGFTDLLSGDVNWPMVTAALKNIGYNGWATAEMIPAYTHYPEQIIYNTSNSMDKILKGE